LRGGGENIRTLEANICYFSCIFGHCVLFKNPPPSQSSITCVENYFMLSRERGDREREGEGEEEGEAYYILRASGGAYTEACTG
jgi:hypothetical protein